MLVSELLVLLEEKAPIVLAQQGDNCGLLVGDERAVVRRVLATLELTSAVLDEALSSGCDTILTHHPFLFAPVRSLVESNDRERLLRRLVQEHVTMIACHTNVDSARGGLADIAGAALGLQGMEPLQPAAAGWYKLVGFVPPDALDLVAAAVFAAGGGGIGNYKDCAFGANGTGWFTPLPGSNPVVGEVARAERAPEVRWETVVPRARLGAAVRAFVGAHPYEEPVFDIYPVEDVLARAGLGRVGTLPEPLPVSDLAAKAAQTFEVSAATWSGEGGRRVARVGVLPGSGRSAIESASGLCEVLITGDLGYHAAEQAAERGLSLIDVPHGEFEWWAFKRWTAVLVEGLEARGASLSVSREWRPPWRRSAEARVEMMPAAGPRLRVWIDGGSRGNPGPSGIGVVVEDPQGGVLDAVGRVIGVGTNNVAEYRALLLGLELAKARGASEVEVLSDSELLVKQMRGEYKVKNEGLRPLHVEARERAAGFSSFSIRHVARHQNARADALVNRALDEHEKAGL